MWLTRILADCFAQVCLVVAKVASGRAQHAEGEEEEKLALEGPPRRSSSRHHSRHLGNTSSPGSSSLDTAVSLPRCASTRTTCLSKGSLTYYRTS